MPLANLVAVIATAIVFTLLVWAALALLVLGNAIDGLPALLLAAAAPFVPVVVWLWVDDSRRNP